VLAGAVLTGGLHLDGLADTCDGLFLGGDAERRLAVMRDPHVGSHGIVALILTLIGKFAALAALSEPRRSLALFGAWTVSRALILVAAGWADYARPEGTGRIVVQATTRHEAVAATAFVLLIASFSASARGLVAALAALFLTAGLTWIARRRLGGITGDILGASVELGEMAYLVVMSI
jgi:adenosylcobinamide-GDP ribazoletransferase